MGWYFSPQSRSELIAELIAPQETERASVKVIAHTRCAATCCGPSSK
jgi:type I restriction-modification system DNA methylase subunit